MTDEKRIYCRKHNRSDLDGCEQCEREKGWGIRKERTLTISVDVGLDWLTAEGERDEKEGWKEITDAVNVALRAGFNLDMLAGCLNASAEEWIT